MVAHSSVGNDPHRTLTFVTSEMMDGMENFEIVGLVVSPLHRMEGRPADGITPYDGVEGVDSATVRAHLGIVGDRFFNTKFTYASVTFISEEAIHELEGTFGAGPFDPALARRNVITRGIDVDALARTTFTIETDAGAIGFRSLTPANPCAWMNEVFAPGAHQALRGHAGIRAEPLSGGILRLGPARLTEVTPIPPGELRQRVQSAPA